MASKGPSWVLDTCVLVTASDTSYGHACLTASALLEAVGKACCLALDHEGEIRKEYSSNIRPQSHAAVWLAHMSQRQRLVFFTHRVPRRHARRLTELAFDTSDWKFVGVAWRTGARILVTEDSDFRRAEVSGYLQERMGLSLLQIPHALAAIRKEGI